MARQELRDNKGRLIGYTHEVNGKIELRTRGWELKGWYDTKTNETRDRGNRRIGHGNLLLTLLDKD